jgi:[FeFe] hydrogenase H-cluster maturation GTPase HydF
MPRSLRPYIGIFGRRNAGKSAFINSVSGQEIAIVSAHPGTTTDPVQKTVEIPGIGPVIFVDTAGVDDAGDLGEQRVKATWKAMAKIDLGILVIDQDEIGTFEQRILERLDQKNTPFIIVRNKTDLVRISEAARDAMARRYRVDVVPFSALVREGVADVVEKIKINLPTSAYNRQTILGDLVGYGDLVLLITPIDIEAPHGRIILPQVQTIRDILDNDCVVLMMKERELDGFFRRHPLKPKLAVTDSQCFLKAAAAVPEDVPLTSFSILFSRLKGDFGTFVRGTRAIDTLKDGDRVLVLESCTHHVSGDDIGRVKIPRWISNATGKSLGFDTVAGFDDPPFPLETYALVVQCGGCMLTRKQMQNRIAPAVSRHIPVTNYGMAIAYCHGIFDRAVALFTGERGDTDYL